VVEAVGRGGPAPSEAPVTAAITEGYAGVTRILTADDTTVPEPPEDQATEDQAVDLLAELSRKMAEAAREVRPGSVSLAGVVVWGEWSEAK
jgi:hypothetical protein